jgi:hypothetical protein
MRQNGVMTFSEKLNQRLSKQFTDYLHLESPRHSKQISDLSVNSRNSLIITHLSTTNSASKQLIKRQGVEW